MSKLIANTFDGVAGRLRVEVSRDYDGAFQGVEVGDEFLHLSRISVTHLEVGRRKPEWLRESGGLRMKVRVVDMLSVE